MYFSWLSVFAWGRWRLFCPGCSMESKVEITAHRGDSVKALENTLPAFEKAIESGADWIELDVKETRDNVPVVFHDSSLKRLMGQDGTIRENAFGRDQKTSSCCKYGAWIQ